MKNAMVWSLLICTPVISYGGIEILDVTSTVSYEKSAPIPGGLTSVFVRGLTGIEGTIVVEKYPAATHLAGVQVKIHGLSAPVLMVSQLDGYQQINVQVPWKADMSARPAVEVIQGSESATVDDVPLGILDSIFPGDDGYAIAYHASDWSRVTESNPAREGESIIYFAANVGPVAPSIPDGALAPENDPPGLVVNYATDYYDFYIVDAARSDDVISVARIECGDCRPRLASGLLGIFAVEFSLVAVWPVDVKQHGLVLVHTRCESGGVPCRVASRRTSKAVPLHIERVAVKSSGTARWEHRSVSDTRQ